MPMIKERPRPTAFALRQKEMGRLSLKYGRTILLSTGRGESPITPHEALLLIADLRAAVDQATGKAAPPAAG